MTLQELHRVLKPGARVAVLDFNNTDDALVDWFQGFSLENIVVPAARLYGLAEEYEYLRPSIKRFATGMQHYVHTIWLYDVYTVVLPKNACTLVLQKIACIV